MTNRGRGDDGGGINISLGIVADLLVFLVCLFAVYALNQSAGFGRSIFDLSSGIFGNTQIFAARLLAVVAFIDLIRGIYSYWSS